MTDQSWYPILKEIMMMAAKALEKVPNQSRAFKGITADLVKTFNMVEIACRMNYPINSISVNRTSPERIKEIMSERERAFTVFLRRVLDRLETGDETGDSAPLNNPSGIAQSPASRAMNSQAVPVSASTVKEKLESDILSKIERHIDNFGSNLSRTEIYFLQLQYLRAIGILTKDKKLFNIASGADLFPGLYVKEMKTVDYNLNERQLRDYFSLLQKFSSIRAYKKMLPELEGMAKIDHDASNIFDEDFIKRWTSQMKSGDIVFMKYTVEFMQLWLSGKMPSQEINEKIREWIDHFIKALPEGVALIIFEMQEDGLKEILPKGLSQYLLDTYPALFNENLIPEEDMKCLKRMNTNNNFRRYLPEQQLALKYESPFLDFLGGGPFMVLKRKETGISTPSNNPSGIAQSPASRAMNSPAAPDSNRGSRKSQVLPLVRQGVNLITKEQTSQSLDIDTVRSILDVVMAPHAISKGFFTSGEYHDKLVTLRSYLSNEETRTKLFELTRKLGFIPESTPLMPSTFDGLRGSSIEGKTIIPDDAYFNVAGSNRGLREDRVYALEALAKPWLLLAAKSNPQEVMYINDVFNRWVDNDKDLVKDQKFKDLIIRARDAMLNVLPNQGYRKVFGFSRFRNLRSSWRPTQQRIFYGWKALMILTQEPPAPPVHFKLRQNSLSQILRVPMRALGMGEVEKETLTGSVLDVGPRKFLGAPKANGPKTGSTNIKPNDPNRAMNVRKQNQGGINLNPAQMSMQIKGQTEDFKFEYNGQTIDAAQVSGVTFTIGQMTPVTNMAEILALN